MSAPSKNASSNPAAAARPPKRARSAAQPAAAEAEDAPREAFGAVLVHFLERNGLAPCLDDNYDTEKFARDEVARRVPTFTSDVVDTEYIQDFQVTTAEMFPDGDKTPELRAIVARMRAAGLTERAWRRGALDDPLFRRATDAEYDLVAAAIAGLERSGALERLKQQIEETRGLIQLQELVTHSIAEVARRHDALFAKYGSVLAERPDWL